jgi:hypothetical protein
MGEVIMRGSNARGTLMGPASLRKDVAALTRRVRRLEEALRPTKRKTASVDVAQASKRWDKEIETARHKALMEFYGREQQAWLQDPEIARLARESREKLKAFLKERGLDPDE